MVRKSLTDLPAFREEKPILADRVNAAVGSGTFILCQSIFLAIYIVYQSFVPVAFDKFPFILLNLLLSFQAAYTGPFVLWSQNRAADRDRNVMHYIRDSVASIKSVVDSVNRMEKRNEKHMQEMEQRLSEIEKLLKG